MTLTKNQQSKFKNRPKDKAIAKANPATVSAEGFRDPNQFQPKTQQTFIQWENMPLWLKLDEILMELRKLNQAMQR